LFSDFFLVAFIELSETPKNKKIAFSGEKLKNDDTPEKG
jgi:hypothetical protein